MIKDITSDQWEWCLRTNGTYIDCPIAERQDKNFAVIAENPSYIDVQYIKLKVGHGNYDVFTYNPTTKANDPQPAEVVCLERFLENGTFIHDCDMHINATVPKVSHTIFIIKYNPNSNLTLPEIEGNKEVLVSDYESFDFLGSSTDGFLF